MFSFLRLIAVVLSVSLSAAAETRLTLIAGADLDGALATASCRPEAPLGPSIAHLAAALEQAEAAAQADGRSVLARVHLGDLSGPSALGRFLIREPRGPERFAALAARLGLDRVVAGNIWFDTNPKRTSALAAALSARGVEMMSSNVACAERLDCQAMEAMAAPVVTPEGVGLIGLLGDDVFPTIDPQEREGLNQTPVAKAIDVEARKARDAGARTVVAFLHLSSEGLLAPVVRLATEAKGVDLIVVNAVKDAASSLVVLDETQGAPIVVLGHAPHDATRIDFDLEEGRVVELRARRVEASAPDVAMEAEVGAVRDAFCRALDVTLVESLPSPVAEVPFIDFVLDTMRRTARAEVAVVNRDAIDARALPLSGRVLAADVFAALPFEDQLVRVTLTGARLRALWASPARARLGWAGVTERDGQIRVNERPLEDGQRYTVAMPDYVANGGAGLIGEPVPFTVVRNERGRALHLRAAVLDRMRQDDAVEALTGRGRLDLSSVPRWTWSGAITLAANNTQLANAAAYEDARLKRSVASALKGEAAGRADAHTLDHALRFTGRARYGQSRVSDGGTTNVAETEDQIFGEALYRLSALQAWLEQAWYSPLPYASTSLDTEFVRNDSAAFRRLEWAGTVGLRMAPLKPLELKAGAGVRREILDPTGRNRFGLELGYELPRFSPISMRGLPVDIESGLDYFVSDPAGDARQEGRFRVRVLLPLGGPLAFTAGFDVFAFKQGAQPFAFVTDATLGLTARLDGGRQQF